MAVQVSWSGRNIIVLAVRIGRPRLSIDVDDNLDPAVNMGFSTTKSAPWTKWDGAGFTTLAAEFVSPSRLSVTRFQRLIAFAGLRRFMTPRTD